MAVLQCFSLVSYNVWFGWDGRGQPYCAERMKGIVDCLLEHHKVDCPLLACGFQEVVPEHIQTLQPLLQAAGFQFFCQPGNHYGCSLFVHQASAEILDHGWRNYSQTNMLRGFLYVRLRIKNSSSEILFTTTHLESPTDRQGSSNAQDRTQQIRELEAFCNQQLCNHPHLQLVVISGDLNWNEQNRDIPLLEMALKTPSWKDAWLETSHDNGSRKDYQPNPFRDETSQCRSDRTLVQAGGYTFDCQTNPFLDGTRQSRLDRILVQSSSMFQKVTPMIPIHRIMPSFVQLFYQIHLTNCLWKDP